MTRSEDQGLRNHASLLLAAALAALVFAAAAHAAQEAAQPADAVQFTTGILGAGEPFETPYYIQDTGRKGPTVAIVGGLHGNEPAGAEAAEQIRHWSITRGRLIIVPRANPPALEADTRHTPGKDEELRNLNRNFPRTGDPPTAVRGRTAAALWKFLQQHEIDWLLDLHEGFDFHISNSNSVGSSVIHLDEPEAAGHAHRMLDAVNAEVEDEDKRFVSLDGGPINSGVARAAIAHLGVRSAMILETTHRGQPLSLRVRQHRIMVHRFLADLEMIDHGPHVLAPPVPGRYIGPDSDPSADAADTPAIRRVAIYQGEGAGSGGIDRVRQIVDDMPDARATLIRPEDIRDGGLSGFHAVAFTGGRGGAQGRALGDAGRAQVQAFIREGGGYLGVCAGAYLATCRLDDYLHMVGAYHHQPWAAGRGRVDIELTTAGEQWLDAPPDAGTFDVRYANGPLFFHEDGDVPDAGLDLPEFEVLAYFRSAVRDEEDAWQRVMIDTPAIVGSVFGEGRLVLVSPHPESDAERQWVIEGAIRHITAGLSVAVPAAVSP